MKKLPMTIPFSIEPLKSHKQIKARLLFDILTTQKYTNVIDENDNTNITRCDWNGFSRDKDRPWVQTFMPHLTEHLSRWIELLDYKSFIVRDLWFQQYAAGSEHDWHIHSCNWTGVYFLDMPVDSLKTLFKDPMNPDIINQFEVTEGDILIFPSFVIHKAPINQDVQIKTIISWNMDTELRPV